MNEWHGEGALHRTLHGPPPPDTAYCKMSYEGAKKRAEPYTKIVEELPEMRRDAVELVKKALGEMRKAYVLVNNRSEGNAPLTIQALRNALQDAQL